MREKSKYMCFKWSPESEADMAGTTNVNKLCMGCMRFRDSSQGSCPVCGFDLEQYKPSPHLLQPDTILNGKYLVGRVLGEGGFGITYIGWDINLEMKIAIKEYYPTGFVTRENTSMGNGMVAPFTGDKGTFYEQGLERFIREAKSLAKFYNLPGIVSVKDFFREKGTAYIVMEFVDGVTLKQHLHNCGGKMNPNTVFEFIRPLTKSLDTIHKEGIIHRDISPDNIMVTIKGEVKLIDFGAARDFSSEENKSRSVLLKPGYAPEEQYRTKGNQGPWTDVYALCATIYKMLTGETPPESLERYGMDSIVRPSALGVVISSQLENAMMKGLAVFQKDRYQTVMELAEAMYGVNPVQNYAIEKMSQDNQVSFGINQYYTGYQSQNQSSIQNINPSLKLQKGKKSRKKVVGLALVGLLAVTFGGLFFLLTPSNHGSIDASSDFCYYGEKGLSVNLDGKTVKGLSKSRCRDIVTDNEWIYFSNFDDNGYLYKIKSDGSMEGVVIRDSCENIEVIDDTIYFSNASDDYRLYKIGTDGSEKEKVSDAVCFDIEVDEDYIYYTELGDTTDSYNLCKMNRKGKKSSVISPADSVLFKSDGDYLYFAYAEGKGVARVNKEDATLESLIDDKIINMFSIYKDRIYYATEDGIFTVKTDGSDVQEVTQDLVASIDIEDEEGTTFKSDSNIYVEDDWIYYWNASDRGYLYKINKDGTERQCISKETSIYTRIQAVK